MNDDGLLDDDAEQCPQCGGNGDEAVCNRCGAPCCMSCASLDDCDGCICSFCDMGL